MPYKSDAQRRYFNANRSALEEQGVDVDEWNESSKGKKLPEKVKEKEASDALSTLCQRAAQLLGQTKKARCWEGYEPVPGKKPYSEDSCRPAGSGKKKSKAKEKKAFAAGAGILLGQAISKGLRQLPDPNAVPALAAIGALTGGGVGAAAGALFPDQYEEENEYGQKQLKTRSRLASALRSGGLGALTGGGLGFGKGLMDQLYPNLHGNVQSEPGPNPAERESVQGILDSITPKIDSNSNFFLPRETAQAGEKQSSFRTMTHLAAGGLNFNPTQFNAKAPGNVYAGGLGGGLNGSAIGNNWGQAAGTNAAAISESGRTKVSADGKGYGFFHYSANKPTIGDGNMNAVYNFGHNLGNLALNSHEKRAFAKAILPLLRGGLGKIFGNAQIRNPLLAGGAGGLIGRYSGYGAGHSAGHDVGHAAGLTEGHNAGYEEGSAIGEREVIRNLLKGMLNVTRQGRESDVDLNSYLNPPAMAKESSDIALLGALAALQEKTAVGPIRRMIQNRPRLFPNLGRRRGQVTQYEEPAAEEAAAPESAPPPATFNAQNPQHGALGGLPGSVMNSINKFKGNQMVNGAASSALTGAQSALGGLAQGAGSVLGNAGNALRNSAQGMAQKATALGQMDKNVRNLPSDQAADANIGLLRDNIRQFAPQAFSKTPPAAATGGNTGTIYDTYRQPAAVPTPVAARPAVNPYGRTGNISGGRGRDF
jgi:hypothetical protein